jgi:hypothetical protein
MNTKLKAGVATVVVAVIAILLVREHQDNRQLRAENELLRKHVAEMDQWVAENKRDLLAKADSPVAPAPNTGTNEQFREVLKLRGEVGRLTTAINAPKPSPISAVISDPEMRKTIRDQQKIGMTILYKDFTNRVSLASDQKEKFVDLLADGIMEGVDQVGAVLRDGKSPKEIDEAFTAQEQALREKVKALLGPDGFAQYEDYTRSLSSHLTAEQLKGQFTGDKPTQEDKASQLYQLMQQETQAALAAAGLPADFQTIPIMNFRNIASEEEAERNLKLLEEIFRRVAAGSTGFLSQEEISKLNEFRERAVQQNRMSLVMNRRLMAPGAK